MDTPYVVTSQILAYYFGLFCYLAQAFLFDLFSASGPSEFAETLSFFLEVLSLFPLSFEGMSEDFKNSIFLL